MFTWSFNTAEGVLCAAVETVRPAVKIIEGPLQRIDQMLCNSLDIVEQRVPSVYLPPRMVSDNEKKMIITLKKNRNKWPVQLNLAVLEISF